MSDEAYINVFKNYQKLERVIDTFMARSRRANNSRWCRTLQGYDFTWCTTKSDILDAMNGNRYFKVNACSYSRHRTIEFRQHQVSTMVLSQPIIFIRVWTIAHSCATSRRSEMTKTALYISDLPLMAQYAGPTVIRLQRMAFISLTMGL